MYAYGFGLMLQGVWGGGASCYIVVGCTVMEKNFSFSSLKCEVTKKEKQNVCIQSSQTRTFCSIVCIRNLRHLSLASALREDSGVKTGCR